MRPIRIISLPSQDLLCARFPDVTWHRVAVPSRATGSTATEAAFKAFFSAAWQDRMAVLEWCDAVTAGRYAPITEHGQSAIYFELAEDAARCRLRWGEGGGNA